MITLYPRVYDTYSFQIIPPLGEVFAGDWKSYQYLVESIRKFHTQVTINKYFCEKKLDFLFFYFLLLGSV
jgi:2-methoxy-6-polyprenyl-1,4-benzoquinol methylase